MNTVLQPDPEMLQVLKHIARGNGPARMFGVKKKNGKERWFIQKSGAQFEGVSQKEVMRKLYITARFGLL